jgi:hypothetical protein
MGTGVLTMANKQDERFIHSHSMEADCDFKKPAKRDVGKKKRSKSGSGRLLNALKKEQKKITKILRDGTLSLEAKEHRINKIYNGGSSHKRKHCYSSSFSSSSDSSFDSD